MVVIKVKRVSCVVCFNKMASAQLAQKKEFVSDLIVNANHVSIYSLNQIAEFCDYLNVVIKAGDRVREFEANDISTLFSQKNRFSLPHFRVVSLYPNLTSIEIIKRGRQIFFNIKKRHVQKVRNQNREKFDSSSNLQ